MEYGSEYICLEFLKIELIEEVSIGGGGLPIAYVQCL